MGYCFHLYTPDLKEQDSGKFVACSKIFFGGGLIALPTIAFYEEFLGRKYIDIYNSCVLLDTDACEIADKYSETTFFTDFLKKHNCSGMIVRIT